MENIKFSNIVKLDSINSTNAYIKSNLSNLPDGTVVFARNQTQGRGKFNRKWYGDADCSLFCSFLVKDILSPYDAVRLNFKFSLVVKQLLLKYANPDIIQLKWPNDILVKPNKKICGILSEYTHNSIITGIGINVKQFDTPGHISNIMTFLEEISNVKIDLNYFQEDLVIQANQYFNQTESFSSTEFPGLWYKEANIENKNVEVLNNNIRANGIIKGITDYGALVIKETSGTTKIITSGDITYYD